MKNRRSARLLAPLLLAPRELALEALHTPLELGRIAKRRWRQALRAPGSRALGRAVLGALLGDVGEHGLARVCVLA